ncbi:B2 bradykinin receptor-like [Boleophthalmus pectinirostris]|uniref:B2 bradykinin receptor-like n=1 Tax=Boleophthalmus pectinirostris TaxID=150288 RepID=UPI00242C92CA|nr:B2 bradykinin receptor-like [Boleophthalmus pectinirostris]XP_055010306.1 B2 bradykinin receptor-like [Boleophthalmus pectinirostris]
MDNETSPELECNQTAAWSWLYSMQPFYMSTICFLGILGNAFVLAVFILEKHRRSVADIYLGNLALADLLMLSCLPFWVVAIVNRFHWTFGQAMCQIVNVVIGMNYYCSVLFLTLVSVDRYLVLTQPLSHGRHRQAIWAKIICAVIWIAGVLLSFPAILFRSVRYLPHLDVEACYLEYPHDGWRLRFNFTVIIVGFLIPVPVASYTSFHIVKVLRNSQNISNKGKGTERKAAFLVLIVLAVFIVCWLPYQVVIFLDTLDYFNVVAGCTWGDVLDIGEQLATYVGYSNSTLNPFLYVIVGKQFKQRAKDVLKVFWCKRWDRGRSGYSNGNVTSRQCESSKI